MRENLPKLQWPVSGLFALTMLCLAGTGNAVAQGAPPGFDQPLPNSSVAFMAINGAYVGTIDSGAKTGTLLKINRGVGTIGASVLRTVPLTSLPSGGAVVHGHPDVLFADVLKTEGRVLYITADGQDFSVAIPQLTANGLGKYTEDSSDDGIVTLGGGMVAKVDVGARTATVPSGALPTPPGATLPPDPAQFARGADGSLWFTETFATDSHGDPISNAVDIGQFSAAESFTQFPVPTPSPGTYTGSLAPFNTTIATGADGNIWFLETQASPRNLARLVTTGAQAGQITEFPMPSGGSSLLGIASGADGNLWIKDYAGLIYRITPSGVATTFQIPTKNIGSDVELVPGPDGALWFLEDSKIGRITTTGTITEYTLPVQQVNGTPVYPYVLQVNEDGSAGFFEYTTGQLDLFVVPPSTSPLVAAVLPASRSIEVGGLATVFATMINGGATPVTGCAPATLGTLPVSFTYQTTDATTNALTGTPNTPVSIAAGAAQSFVLAVTANAPFSPADMVIGFSCENADAAQVTAGLDTLLLSASSSPVPDIIALAASADPGIVEIPGADGTGAFVVATDNLGAGAAITATPSTGSATLPVALTICQTNPQTSACLAAPAASVTTTISSNATPTFAIFVAGSGTVPFSPAVNRISVQFADPGGTIRGSTSVAVRTQ